MATLSVILTLVGGPDNFDTKCIVFPYFQDSVAADKIWPHGSQDFSRPYKLPSEARF
jgi:hypothetical protein